jgi:hypothetical protein
VAAVLDWPNEPAGSTLLTDWGLADDVPLIDEALIGTTGWRFNFGAPEGSVTRVQDAGAPFSPPDVWQYSYPTGHPSGAPGFPYISLGNVTSVYCGFWLKVQTPWDFHSAGGEKLLVVLQQSGGNAILVHHFDQVPGHDNTVRRVCWYDPPASSLNLHLDNISPDGIFLYGVEPTPFSYTSTMGSWHRYEFHIQRSTTESSQDGIIRWWVDNQLFANYTNTNSLVSAGFYAEIQMMLYWGGVGDTKTQDDLVWYDHVRISIPPEE